MGHSGIYTMDTFLFIFSTSIYKLSITDCLKGVYKIIVNMDKKYRIIWQHIQNTKKGEQLGKKRKNGE